MSLHFEHCLLGTRLHAQYGAGEAVFSSDNITCLSVLKDVRASARAFPPFADPPLGLSASGPAVGVLPSCAHAAAAASGS